MAKSALVGLGRHTISGMLCASSQQLGHWSAAYRLFEQQRFDREALFAPARRAVLERLAMRVDYPEAHERVFGRAGPQATADFEHQFGKAPVP